MKPRRDRVKGERGKKQYVKTLEQNDNVTQISDNALTITPKDVVSSLSASLQSLSLCSSVDEARSIAETVFYDSGLDEAMCRHYRPQNNTLILSDNDELYLDLIQRAIVVLQEFFDPVVTDSLARSIVLESLGTTISGSHEGADESDFQSNRLVVNEHDDNDINDDHEEDDDDGKYIRDGECELCERKMKLTKHHLIPKFTWRKMLRRILNAGPAIQNGDTQTALRLLGMHHDAAADNNENYSGDETIQYVLPNFLPNHNVANAASIKLYLAHHTCEICRQCHSMIHHLHSELELAEQFNSVERLLKDENVVKFCRWANKQRPGKYASP